MPESHATLTLDNTTIRLNAQEVKEAAQQLGMVVTLPITLHRRNLPPGTYFQYLDCRGRSGRTLLTVSGGSIGYSDVSADGHAWLHRETGNEPVIRRTSFTT